MTDVNRCPECGFERTESSPERLCPRCLMQQALDTEPLPSAGTSVLASLAGIVDLLPRVVLRDDATTGEPSSPEMPELPARPARLQLFGEIARGGMGAILRGRDTDLGRDLAVKVLLEAHRDKPELVRRFVEEAQIGGQLQHPGVVPVHELGALADRRPFFTMKLVKGRTLAALLKERADPTQDQPRFLGIFEQICQTLAYSHARGVIHRDLKPSNVMVGAFGEVQVMDWGLAKVLPHEATADEPRDRADEPAASVIRTVRSGSDVDASRDGSVLGTPPYMAPEQARGDIEAIDERSDVFGLGSILCEILTGRPAYVGPSQQAVLRLAMRADTADALGRVGGCGADVELVALVRDCLAADREDRLRDAGVVARRLDAYLAGVQERLRAAERARAAEEARAEEAQATAAAAEGRARAERRARRMTVALAASILALVGLSGGGLAWLRHRRAQQAEATALAVSHVLVTATQRWGEALKTGNLATWGAALAAAQRAADLLQQGEVGAAERDRVAVTLAQVTKGHDAAKAQARLAEADRRLMAVLERIRGDRANKSGPEQTDAEYTAAFRAAGLDLDQTEPPAAGAWIAHHSSPVELAAYLDDWAYVRRTSVAKHEQASWRRLIEAARAADPDPWRDALRTQVASQNVEALRRLADDGAALGLQPTVSLVLLALQLKNVAADQERAKRVLRRAWRKGPGDFWANYELAGFRVANPDEQEGGNVTPHSEEEAVRHLTAAVAIRPQSALAYNDLGAVLWEEGKPAEAEAEFRAALEIAPNYANAHLNLGNALRLQGKLAEAEAEFREATRLNPNFWSAHVNLGSALAGRGKQHEAESEYRTALRLKPDGAMAHLGLGRVLAGRAQLNQAEACYREATRLKPSSALAHIYLGSALRLQGKFAEAEAEAREAVRLKPNYALAHYQLGAILCDIKRDYAGAVAEFREALRIMPNYPNAHIGLGIALGHQGKMQAALAEYRQALRLRPNDVDALNALAWALALPAKRPRHLYEEGLTHARKAVELAPKAGDKFNTLALAEYRSGHWTESLAASQRSLALQGGGYAADWFLLALAHWQKGEKDQARTCFDKAVASTKTKAPANKELLQFWAEAAELLGCPGPDASGPGSPAGPATEKPR